MDVKDFQKDFLEEVKAAAATEGEGSNAAFVNTTASYLMGSEALSDFTLSFHSGTGKRGKKIRVDGYAYDEFDQTFNLVIADYTGEEDRDALTKTEADTLFERLLGFLDLAYNAKFYEELEPSMPVYDLVDQLRVNKDEIRKYRLLLLTDRFKSTRIKDVSTADYNGIPVECQIWDIDRIYRVCFSELSRQDIEIDFKAFTDGRGIPCLEASNANTDDYKSYLCIIPGAALADIYDKYGSQLLEGNVRSFLSTKGAVNKKIRETILRMPEKFFAYNNGISATAMNLKFEQTNEGRFITHVKDFQVINGGQTTASLSNARYKDKADLSKIYVQMKLTEVDSDADKSSGLVRDISRSSNSQNKVSDADFFATHPFHIRMEQISRRLFAPATGGAQYETKWFYERARGQYIQAQMHMTKSQKDKFTAQNPKKQLITKTDLAKFRDSWAEMPHIVSKGAQTNFMKFAEQVSNSWENNEAQFNEKYFKETVALAILFKHTETVVSAQAWFEQGYRANIVTYSIALLHRLIKQQFKNKDLDLQLIWNRQQVPDVVTAELIKITKLVFDKITDPRRGIMNVTQWCKRETCWDDMKNCTLKLSPSLDRVLMSQDENKSAEYAAKKDQHVVSGIEAQTEVLKYSAAVWGDLSKFLLDKKVALTADQRRALNYAMRLPIKLPNSYQCGMLLALLNEAEANGFKVNHQ